MVFQNDDYGVTGGDDVGVYQHLQQWSWCCVIQQHLYCHRVMVAVLQSNGYGVTQGYDVGVYQPLRQWSWCSTVVTPLLHSC
jgi:hypothetical protein